MIDISVIIPSYNRAALLRRAVDSVLSQTHGPSEIIVVDDGSDDDTADIFENHYRHVDLIKQTHAGVSRARNTGILQSRGEWIALLDSDDEWHPNKLEYQVEWIKTHENCKIVHTDEIWIRNGVRVNPHKKHLKSGGHIFQKCLPLCCISPSSVLIKKNVFNHVGLFDESLPACEDYDMWLRICARYPAGYIDKPLINKFGGHADQLSQKFWGMDRFRIQALVKIVDSNILEPKDQYAALSMLLCKLNLMIQGAGKHNNQGLLGEYQLLHEKYEAIAGEFDNSGLSSCINN